LASWVATAGESGRVLVPGRWVKRAAATLAAVVVAGLIAFGAFAAGAHQQHPTTVLTGVATVGDHVATVTVGGWAYGIEGTSVPWIDRQGEMHYGSWPACLGTPGRTAQITFGEVPVTMPDGAIARQVTWVDCGS
jgi:hypothetical protein